MKGLFWLAITLIGLIAFCSGLLGIIPDFFLTELGKNNRFYFSTRFIFMNWTLVISGFVTYIVGINKVEYYIIN